jgi:hypothetical protein
MPKATNPTNPKNIMWKKIIRGVVAMLLVLTAVTGARAQTYSNAVMALNPVAYWPLQETAQPPFGAYIATNIGTAGAAGNGFYQTWFQPWNTGTNTLYYQTNNIQHAAGAIGDGDTALQCTRSTAGAGGYVVFPRATNGVPNPTLALQPPFSIELWVKPSSTTTAVMPIVNQGRIPTQLDAGYDYASTNWTGFGIGQYGTIFFFATYNARGGDSTKQELDVTLIQNQWQHLVITFNGTNQTWFKNGVQAATRTIPGSAANAKGELYVPDPTSPLLIGTGSLLGAGNGGSEYAGNIDEVAIYTNILDSTAIASHYSAASATDATYKNAVLADNPTIYVRLGEPAFLSSSYPSPNTYPVANNYGVIGVAGNGYYQPGTVPGVAGPQFSGFGSSSRSVAINGHSGAVDVGAGSLPGELNPTNFAPMTVAAWFQANPADAPGRFQEIVGHGNSSWRIAMDATAAGARFNPGNGPELQFANSPDILTNGCLVNDGRWHFVAGVSDGTNDFLYLDGIPAKSGSAVGSITSSTLDALIGGDPAFLVPVFNGTSTSQPRYFDGQIAHVAFFTNALGSNQIQQIYAAAGVPPYVWKQPASQTNNAGANVTVTAGARGSAPLAYQWYQNGSPLALQTNANLGFTPVATNNAGNYYLVVTNAYGSATSSVVSLTIFGPPVILQQSLTDMQVFAGTSPTLTVTAVGAQPLRYQWTLNGGAINGATNSSYTVTNAQTSATYGCTVTNIVGATPISAVSLTVLADPTAPYPVKVLADGPVAYFRLDESSGTTAYDYAGGNNAAYTNVNLGQPGYNSTASVPSDPGETSVLFGAGGNNSFAGNVPPYLNFGMTNGGNAAFSVEAWFTEYVFANGGNAIVALGYGNGGEQFVLDSGNGANGTLRFFVRNAAGTVSAASSSYAPVNDGKWHHAVGVCDEAGGHVYLYMDGALLASGTITASSGILNSTFPLSIGARESANSNPVNYDFQFIGAIDDVAIYNKALSAAQVLSHYYSSGVAPLITQLVPVNETTNQGGTATFSVTAVGTSPLSYQWFDNNGTPISYGTNTTLNVTNVQQSQAGSYSVTVSNPYGTATTNANLTVDLGPPQIVVDLQPTSLTTYAGTPNTFSVTVSGSIPFAYQWYQNGSVIAGATSSSYTFAVLTGTNTYYCGVTNSFSVSQAGGPTYSSTATVVGIAAPTLNPTNFTYHTKITFPGYNRPETLADFPVLVKFGTNVPGFAYPQLASATGGDLRFTDASGTRVIPHEIDEWIPGDTSTVWVQVPRLSGTNDFIWAYWGNPADTTLPASSTNGAVWLPAAFEALPQFDLVWHLKEIALPFADSTLQHPATNGVAPVSTNGIVGHGGFLGGGSFLDAGVINLSDAFTLNAWLNLAPGVSDIQTVWANKVGGSGVNGIALFVNTYLTSDQKIHLETGNGTASREATSAAGAVSPGQWHLLAAVVDRAAGSARLFVDGVDATASGAIRTDFANTNDVLLGRFADANFGFHGQLDEVRIQAGTNSANWVWASYMTAAANSTFENYATVVSSAVTITYQVSGGNLLLTWSQGTLQSASQVSGPYADIPGATSGYSVPLSGAGKFYRVKVR